MLIFILFPARCLAGKSGDWRRCKVWGIYLHQCITYSTTFLTGKEWYGTERGYWWNKLNQEGENKVSLADGVRFFFLKPGRRWSEKVQIKRPY